MSEPDVEIDTGPTAEAETAAAVLRAPEDDKGAALTETHPLRLPEEDWNDFRLGVWASVLRKSRKKLEDITSKHRFPWGELLLGVGTLTAGAVLSALIAGVGLDTKPGVFLFTVLPAISVGCLVAYGAVRYTATRTAQHLAEDVLEALPDPDKSKEVEP